MCNQTTGPFFTHFSLLKPSFSTNSKLHAQALLCSLACGWMRNRRPVISSELHASRLCSWYIDNDHWLAGISSIIDIAELTWQYFPHWEGSCQSLSPTQLSVLMETCWNFICLRPGPFVKFDQNKPIHSKVMREGVRTDRLAVNLCNLFPCKTSLKNS